jgi:hypothetical protein
MLSKLILVGLVILIAVVLYMRFSAVRVSGGEARDLVAKGTNVHDMGGIGQW